MEDRTDLEVRVYLTGRPDGQIEWQVMSTAMDGQMSWWDGAVSRYRQGQAVAPRDLLASVSKAVRHACFELRS